MTDPPTVPPVPVAGLLVPAELVPRIVAAFRGTYPAITDGLADDPAVRAVLKHWVATTLAAFEGQTARAPVVDAVQQVQTEYEQKAEEARQKALDDASAIVEDPTDPASPVAASSPARRPPRKAAKKATPKSPAKEKPK